jgi:hypothetical protein
MSPAMKKRARSEAGQAGVANRRAKARLIAMRNAGAIPPMSGKGEAAARKATNPYTKGNPDYTVPASAGSARAAYKARKGAKSRYPATEASAGKLRAMIKAGRAGTGPAVPGYGGKSATKSQKVRALAKKLKAANQEGWAGRRAARGYSRAINVLNSRAKGMSRAAIDETGHEIGDTAKGWRRNAKAFRKSQRGR